MKKKISVVLCTYNNSTSLSLTLKDLAEQVIRNNDEVEVIVVDNNSPDDTAKVVAPYLNHPSITFHYVFEGQQGLSHARNTGLNKASGEYLLFTDDDAAIPSNWISEYLHHIQTNNPDCLFSKIQILWDQPKPWWFIDEFTPCFVGLDYGNMMLRVTDNTKEFYGKNFCIRKNLLIELGGFDPQLGRKGNNLAAGEETLIYREMISRGDSILYFPSAPVGHRLKPREYDISNIRKLYIDGAYSTYHIATLCARKKVMGKPLGLLLDTLKSIPKSVAGLLKSQFHSNPAQKNYYWLNLCRSAKILSLWIRK